MSNIKYLCIDDQNAATIDPFLQNLEKNGLVSFSRSTPGKLENQVPIIEEFARSTEGAIGLLLDLRLDEGTDSNGDRVTYRGPTLAQELRTRMAEKVLRPFPIALWSVNTKFQTSYYGDGSSHDLFDYVFEKDQISDRPNDISAKLASLAMGYLSLRTVEPKGIIALIGLPADEGAPVYMQFIDELVQASHSTHEAAQFLLRNLVQTPGLLISERTLAARLGTDLEASDTDWKIVKKSLEATQYTGPFSDGWPRWWWFQVEHWWRQLAPQFPDLRRLDAKARTSAINEAHRTKLVPAPPIVETYSTKYFVLCAGTGRPLDPVDGLRIKQHNVRSWHDRAYVSAYAALERVRKDRWHLEPFERDRLERIKEEMETSRNGQKTKP